jgi:photosystem II stability/assembly factor-like uncharacterized protein
MKKLIIILTIFLSGFSNSYSQWVKVHQFTDGGVVQDFADNGNIIYAAVTGDGIYKSTNNGVNWFLPDTALQSYNLNAIVAKDSFVFIASNSGIHRSSDFGNSWIRIRNENSYSLTIIYYNNINYIFAGIGPWICKSSNWGDNWIIVNNGLPSYSDAYALSNSNGNVYASIVSSDTQGVFKTTNMGVNWVYTNPTFFIYSKSIYSFNDLVLSGGSPEVAITTDGGNNWRYIPGMLNVGYLFDFASLDVKDIFVGSWTRGFYASNDSGQNWLLKNDGLLSLRVNALHRFGNYLLLSTNPTSSYPDIYRRPLSEVIGINNINTEIPNSSKLFQNYPNPFNSKSKIKYQISKTEVRSEKSGVRLVVYDILGKEIARLVNEKQEAGVYEVIFDAGNLPGGVYFYTLEINGNNYDTKKLLYIK